MAGRDGNSFFVTSNWGFVVRDNDWFFVVRDEDGVFGGSARLVRPEDETVTAGYEDSGGCRWICFVDAEVILAGEAETVDVLIFVVRLFRILVLGSDLVLGGLERSWLETTRIIWLR